MIQRLEISEAIAVEEVILLDERGHAIGRADKASIHTMDTPLHSAFSIFLFNRKGEMLVQQRAYSKKTWPGVWSNACCGHPAPGETLLAAAKRRLVQELGLHDICLHLALPKFRYHAEYCGVVENEFCPVLIGLCNSQPTPNPAEVEAVNWIKWDAIVNQDPIYRDYSPWSKWEAELLQKSGLIYSLLKV